jgi:hypothetical protein
MQRVANKTPTALIRCNKTDAFFDEVNDSKATPWSEVTNRNSFSQYLHFAQFAKLVTS